MALFRTAFIATVLVLATLGAAAAPEVGTAAPEFRLQDQNGNWHTLANHKGKWVVLYFYPKDDTPGCTKQACTFRDDIFKFRAAGAEVLGVSLDDVESHKAFAAKYSLPFPLLADMDKKVADTYGVLAMGGLYAKRDTFLIDPNGVVIKHYPGVKPADNSAEVLAEIESQKAARAAAKPKGP